jgi:hypothetical protein
MMILRVLRKFQLCLFPILLTGSAAQAATNDDNGLLGTDLTTARAHSDYFQFFNLEPTGGAQPSANETSFKPIGSDFRQLVTIYVETDSKQLISGLRVVIARSFIDDPKNGVFARDLIKSTLLATVNATDAASLDDLGTEILYRDRKGTVLTRNEPQLSATPSAAYLVVSGTSKSWETKLRSSQIRLSNQTQENRPSLIITIHAQ